MNLIQEYLEQWRIYTTKYSKEKCTVFYQVGKFYEAYATPTEGSLDEIAELCRLVVTKRDKKKPEWNIKNPKMMGFPVDQLQKFVDILLNNGWTIVVFDQHPIKHDKFERKLYKIFSPGISLERNDNTDNWLFVILNEKEQISVCATELNLGKIKLFYFVQNRQEKLTSLIDSYSPKETVTYEYSSLSRDKHSLQLQEQLFSTLYTPELTTMSCIEYLDLEKYSNLSLTLYLAFQYILEHDPTILRNAVKPEIIVEEENNVKLYGDVDKLDLTKLIQIINFTKTQMGKRLLKERLYRPIFDIEKLNSLYNQTEIAKNHIDEFQSILKSIPDLDRFHRRKTLQIFQPVEFISLHSAYENCLTLLDKYEKYFNIKIKLKKDLQNYISEYSSIFDLTKLTETNFFQKNINSEIDSQSSSYQEKWKWLQDYAIKFSKDVKSEDGVKLTLGDEGYFLQTSNPRASKLTKMYDWLVCKSLKTYSKLTFEEFDKTSSEFLSISSSLDASIKKEYSSSLQMFCKKYSNLFINLGICIAEIDLIVSNAKCAVMYNYSKPILKTLKTFSFEELRHPIVERISETPYIPNDLNLSNGLLLYGLNGVGKSAFLKSVALSVLLAQSGFYVPCKKMVFKPFKKIVSKILNRDDILKGKSTFVLELEYLREMINSNEDSLLLGDELCSGTERDSAISIVASSINAFYKNKSSFILSSHFHELNSLIPKEIQRKHFKVHIQAGNIIFDRKLENGDGEKLYGIEIAKALGLSKEVVSEAFSIRNSILEKSNPKLSRYNSNVVMDKCGICNSTLHLHTHHIIFQKEANEWNVIGNIRKNDTHNLVVLCENCHNQVHRGEIIINGYISSVKGIELQFQM